MASPQRLPAEGNTQRRRLLCGALGALAAAFTRPARAAATHADATATAQARRQAMAWAAQMRRRAVASGDQAFGAVIVRNGKLVGEGPSRVVVNDDPTAHAEMEAIRDAARRLGGRDLAGCELYATSMPCPMCQTAAYWANLDRIYVGPQAEDTGPPRYGRC